MHKTVDCPSDKSTLDKNMRQGLIILLTFFSVAYFYGQVDTLNFALLYPKPGQYKEYCKSGKVKIEGVFAKADSIECVNCYDKNENKIIFKAHATIMRVGEWKEYYENGQIKACGVYNGIHETYGATYPKDYGTKQFVTYFVPGDYREEYLKDKSWKYYNESGQLIREEYYFNGVLADVEIHER